MVDKGQALVWWLSTSAMRLVPCHGWHPRPPSPWPSIAQGTCLGLSVSRPLSLRAPKADQGGGSSLACPSDGIWLSTAAPVDLEPWSTGPSVPHAEPSIGTSRQELVESSQRRQDSPHSTPALAAPLHRPTGTQRTKGDGVGEASGLGESLPRLSCVKHQPRPPEAVKS